MDVRRPSENESKVTKVLEFFIEEASSKVRSGPPLDGESDYGLAVWAGGLPLVMKSESPVPDKQFVEGRETPDYVRNYDARLRSPAQNRRNSR
jgi:hypothetical protein